jgi:hypothetical protein
LALSKSPPAFGDESWKHYNRTHFSRHSSGTHFGELLVTNFKKIVKKAAMFCENHYILLSDDDLYEFLVNKVTCQKIFLYTYMYKYAYGTFSFFHYLILSKTCLNFWQNMYQFLVNQNVS